jgi:hypothetical protein
MIKIYPSSAAFAKGAVSTGPYNNSCYRWQVVADQAGYLKSDINPIHAAVGEIDERRFEQVLKSRGYEVEAEVARQHEIAPEAVISGRRDFVIKKDGETAIVEKKSTISRNKRTNINKRRIEESQLAQLVTYMVLDGIETGFLVQTFYYLPKELNRLEVGAEVEYKIMLKERSIYVDGELYGRTLDDLATYYKHQAYYRTKKKIGPRPEKAMAPYGSPCSYCPMQEKCTAFDLGSISEKEMLETVPEWLKEKVDNQEPRPVEIWVSKRK